MSAAEVHLTLNHLPVLLSTVGAGLLGAGLYLRSSDLKNAGFFFMILGGLVAIPVYLSGQPAEVLLKNYPGVSRAAIHEHENAAWYSFIALEISAAGALVAFILLFRKKAVSKLVCVVLLLLVAVACGALVRTAHLGGLIRHEEIQTPAESERFDAGSSTR